MLSNNNNNNSKQQQQSISGGGGAASAQLDLNNNNHFELKDVMHKLHATNYLTPTYCDYCSQLLFGLIKQGVKCEKCGQNFHKRCVEHMPKICNKQLNEILMNQDTTTSPTSHSTTTNVTRLPHPDQLSLINSNIPNRLIEIEHTFLRKQINNQNLVCDSCSKRIFNDSASSFYLSCRDCSCTVHLADECSKTMEKNCKSLATPTSPNDLIESPIHNSTTMTAHGLASIIEQQMSIEDHPPRSSILEVSNETSTSEMSMTSNNHDSLANSPSSGSTSQIGGSQGMMSRNYGKAIKKNGKRNQICLQRLSQRIRKTGGYFWSGYMYYHTKEYWDGITHYWKLDSQSVAIYDSYRLEKKLKEIALGSIKRAFLCGVNMDASSPTDSYSSNASTHSFIHNCLFVIRTEDEAFYCGMGNADPNSPMNVLARNFYNIFKMVYLPYASANRHGIRKSFKISAPKYEEKSLHEEYTINPQELLGSGQFGQVYGGFCKANDQTVAIKVIDKTRFKDFHAETSVFQNEITILYNMQHPGIVRLHALFDEVDHLYIVTEKMATDMLEMILNKQPARLLERVAKFIIYQILIALSKLHERNIAHCDLKPENILLTENVPFPQVKICDFGYAKIIGENSFRRSMVGTPAYSPPELKQKRLYNNSIDMWSMGVIVYVSLSGTFPFEEDRDIHEQILNSNFMFPHDPWDSVSPEAIELINQFLQVRIDRRMSANRALQHKWFSEDRQLFFDLKDLESRVGLKWLTTKDQEQKWLSG